MSSHGKANAALAAAVVFLLLSSCAAYLTFTRLNSSQQWVRHTREVQGAMAQFAMTTSRAGRLRSEYVDSGEVSLLQRQADAVRDTRGSMAALQRLTADNAREQTNCRRLADLTEQRIALMDHAIALKRNGNSSPAAQVQISRQILAAAEESDQVLQQMYDTEEQLLTERQARVRRSTVETVSVLALSLLLALILFLVHNRLLVAQVRARREAENAQRTLSARLLVLQDEERRKFARELHDSVGQHLAAMKMGISILQAKLPDDSLLQDCIKLLDESIAETRTISHLLHPPLLDEAGLKSACRWFVEGFAQRSGIEVNLDIQDGGRRLMESTELALFRVLQESLTNVHRHSGATRADVSLLTSANSVILRVKDYGHGIPPAVLQRLREDSVVGGVGFAGMTERVREIGGQLEIASSAEGTEVIARVPISRRPERAEIPSTIQEVKR
jgi:signal transduction histidine kinase